MTASVGGAGGVEVGVVGERDLDDAMHAVGRGRGSQLRRVGRRARRRVLDRGRPGEVAAAPTVPITVAPPQRASCAAIEADRAEHAMDEDVVPVDRAVAEDGAVGGDAGDAQARAELVADLVGQRDRLLGGHTVSCAAVPKGR